MGKKAVKIRSSEGRDFDCYVVAPDAKQKVPAMRRADG